MKNQKLKSDIMSKVCLITDLHWGCRNDSLTFVDFYDRFYTNVFFPKLDQEGIKTVFILGDVFDRRKYINFVTLEHAKRILFDQLKQRNIKVYIIVGNHDAPYKNSIKTNSVDLLLSDYDNVTVINHPQDIDEGDHKICMVPWICQDNATDAMTLMENTESTICMGHFEIAGFAMYKGIECHEGLDRSVFGRFEQVFSGHYHHRSTDGQITYLGNPYELTWQDYNDPRGFHLFDLATRGLEFIENPYRMFHKIHYDDQLWESQDQINAIPVDQYANAYVKVIVRSNTNPLWFDGFIEKLEQADVADIQVVDDHLHLDLEDDDDIINEAEDTITMLKKYVDGLNLQTDKSKLEGLLQSLYNEALTVQ